MFTGYVTRLKGAPVRWSLRLGFVCFGVVLFLLIASSGIGQESSVEDIQVRVERWLEVQQLSGQVTLQSRSGPLQYARIGSRLQFIGDMLFTDANSETTLAVDTTVGFIDVAERTSITLAELRSVPDGGRVTKLVVTQGQARLRVRPFTHDSSELEIETPAGWSAVRGTEFGITVHPDGKTGLATLEGAVVTSGQGEMVEVDAGFQTLIVPNEVPLPPIPFEGTGNTQLRPRVLTALDDNVAQIIGVVDPVNLLIVNDDVQPIGSDGVFDLQVSIPENRLVRAKVITPLGSQQTYDLAIP
ncbi:MAG: FecR domain-containing protein [Cyanobacteria bacterium P01_E01_bin.6]